MTLPRTLPSSALLLAAALIAPLGCEVDKSLGDLGDATATDSGSGTTDGPTPTSSDEDTTAPPLACPDNPDFACGAPLDCDELGGCGGPLSEVDADGCLRPRCSAGECPDGYTCVSLGDWGSCAASSTFCEASGDECACGGTADCSESVSICVQDEEAPPAACNTFTDEAACLDAGCSAFQLVPRVEFDEASGTCSCAASEPEPTCLWFPGGNQGGDDVLTPYVTFGALGERVMRLLPASYDVTPLGWYACTELVDDETCACAQALSCP